MAGGFNPFLTVGSVCNYVMAVTAVLFFYTFVFHYFPCQTLVWFVIENTRKTRWAKNEIQYSWVQATFLKYECIM